MRARLFSVWEAVRASYWFVPTVMALGAFCLSFVMIQVDVRTPHDWIESVPWLYSGSPEGARSLLSAIASSMITTAGVVFSITIVALTLASQQFGPRLLRNFMRDLGNQVVLGMFISAFLYCLMILRQVHGESDDQGVERFLPQLSMIVAVAMAIAGLGVLIYFIHHTALSIQAPSVIAAVSRELHGAIDHLYPEPAGGDARASAAREPPPALPDRSEEECATIDAGEGGYVQRIEMDQLVGDASKHDLVLRIERRPGRYVQADECVIRAWPAARIDDDVRRTLRGSFTVHSQRSLTQDAEFAIDQLVEIGARAISPGINDPFTAVQCVDRLAEALSRLAGRPMPSPHRKDDAGRLRVVGPTTRFCDFVDAAFNQLRHDSERVMAVMLRLLEAFEKIARHTKQDEDRDCLAAHARAVYQQAMGAAKADMDRSAVEERYAAFTEALRRDGVSARGREDACSRPSNA